MPDATAALRPRFAARARHQRGARLAGLPRSLEPRRWPRPSSGAGALAASRPRCAASWRDVLVRGVARSAGRPIAACCRRLGQPAPRRSTPARPSPAPRAALHRSRRPEVHRPGPGTPARAGCSAATGRCCELARRRARAALSVLTPDRLARRQRWRRRSADAVPKKGRPKAALRMRADAADRVTRRGSPRPRRRGIDLRHLHGGQFLGLLHARWRGARRRPSLPWPCAPRGRPCRYRRGSGGRR